ncbi:sensor histidine kinase [Oceanobacillus profundus]|uniref:sensor histidine kinase n=1 Tax=Oceanobacillus TaxID=182709 RepID=UPI0026E48EF8|nr:sensor histidine kinase [Oceanobacillus profundus]MDO6449864.1 sensor histidine kinase [Oceanobacillus profundus]
MKVYWIWLLFNISPWIFALAFFSVSMVELLWRLLGVAIYFVIFFVMPLVTNKPVFTMILLSLNTCIAVITLFPSQGDGFNPFLILILSLLIGEACYYLNFRQVSVVVMVGMAGIIALLLSAELSIFTTGFIVIYFIFLLIASFKYKQTKYQNDDLRARYDALLSEYRSVKRRLSSDEELARQEERVLIGHEIHDSVGHKLTALLMQLEVFRLQAAEDDKSQIESLKELANQSLEETRNAVKMLKSKDVGGLAGVLRLIRKLETESFIRIHFSVKHGAFAAPLTGEQSFVIYRSVQEALTNIMKHSNAREAEVMFEAPGGSIFRFEINNPVKNDNRFQEGFGLASMRERIEKTGGELHVQKTDGQFIVRGLLKIADLGEVYDSNTTG